MLRRAEEEESNRVDSVEEKDPMVVIKKVEEKDPMEVIKKVREDGVGAAKEDPASMDVPLVEKGAQVGPRRGDRKRHGKKMWGE